MKKKKGGAEGEGVSGAYLFHSCCLYGVEPRFVQTKARHEAISKYICISSRCCCVGVLELCYVGKCNTLMIPLSKFSRCFDASPSWDRFLPAV